MKKLISIMLIATMLMALLPASTPSVSAKTVSNSSGSVIRARAAFSAAASMAERKFCTACAKGRRDVKSFSSISCISDRHKLIDSHRRH